MASAPGTKVLYLAPTIAELDEGKQKRPLKLRRRSARLTRDVEPHWEAERDHTSRSARAEDGKRPKETESLKNVFKTSNGGIQRQISPIANQKCTNSVTRTPLQALSIDGLPDAATTELPEKGSELISDSGAIARKSKGNSTSLDTGPNRDENWVKAGTPAKKQVSSPLPVSSKAQYLRLGRARAVGLQRKHKGKAIIFPAPLNITQPGKVVLEQRPGPRPLAMTRGNRSTGHNSIGGTTTIESIPPPPTHLFSLSSITSIYTLLSSPNNYLSSHQGGSQHETSLKFNVLALVIRVEGLESCPDWRAGGGKMMDRCEIIVKDSSDCAIKVVLEGNCATRWAHTNTNESFVAEQDPSNYSHETNPFDASISAAIDTSTFANGSELEIQRLNKLFPLRPGDVIVLSRLVLTRPQRKKASLRLEKGAGLASVFATASPRWEPQIELCWRNDIRCDADQRRNFDQSLTAFDARCKAIFRLATAWHA